MAGPSAIWGIDIGQCGLKALKLQPSGDDLEVVAFDYVEHAKILSQPDAERPVLIQNALEKFLSRNDVTGDSIFVSVPGQQTFSRFTKLPPVEPKRIPEIVRFEASQQIPFDMDAVVWDYQTFTAEGSPDVEVGIFAMKRDLIRKALEPFTELQLEPVGVQAGPLALYNGLRFDGQLGSGATIIIDVGAENSDLIVAEGDSIWTRNIPLGGNNFTEALVKAFKLSFAKAENLKRTAASSKYARQIFQAMRPVFADLVAEIQRSIGFYTSTHRRSKLERAIGMGNAFKLPGLQKFLQQNLGIPVHPPSNYKRLTASQVSGAPQFMEHVLTFGTAYGLAVQGLDLATVTSNLLPPEVGRQTMWRKKRVWFAAAAACLVASSLGIWARYMLDSNALARTRGNPVPSVNASQADQIVRNGVPGDPRPFEFAQRVRAAAAALATEYQSKKGTSGNEQQKMQSIVDLQQNKALWIRILDVIHRSLPRPPHELRDAAEDPEAIKAAYSSIQRGQRPEIYIDSLTSEFTEDVNLDAMAMDAFSDADVGAFTAGPAQPGFWVTVEGWTPYVRGTYPNGCAFVSAAFIEALRANSRREKNGFYFDAIALEQCAPRLTAAAAPGGAGPGFAPGRPAFSGGAGRHQSDGHVPRGGGSRSFAGPSMAPTMLGGAGGPQFLDPFLNESMDGDSKFLIRFNVVLGDPPEDPEAAAATP